MNKMSKFLILLGVCLIFISMILSAGNFSKIFEPFYTEEYFDYTDYSVDSYNIHKVIVDINNNQVKIKPHSGNEIKITYPDGKDYNYIIDNSNGILSIIKPAKLFRWQIGVHLNFRIPEVVIEIPENLELEYDISSANSSIELNDLNILNSTFKTGNGRIKFTNISSKEAAKLDTSNARIILNNINISEINAKTSNGRIEANNITADKIEFKTSNAKIEFANLNSPNIKLQTSNGSIKGWITGFAADYYKTINTSNGRITINNEDYGREIIDSISNSKVLNVKSTNGSININFK